MKVIYSLGCYPNISLKLLFSRVSLFWGEWKQESRERSGTVGKLIFLHHSLFRSRGRAVPCSTWICSNTQTAQGNNHPDVHFQSSHRSQFQISFSASQQIKKQPATPAFLMYFCSSLWRQLHFSSR